MTTILNADPAAIATLERRSRQACVVYADYPLPPGCSPANADIGIERHDRQTLLHVRRGVHYQGQDDDVRVWIASATRSFETFGDCLRWLRDHAPAGPRDTRQAVPAASVPTRLPIADVTELDEVRVAEPARLTVAELEASLSAHVLGQGVAVKGLAELAAHHVAKPFPRRPASAMLIGPTGTGKTLAAEHLAELLTQTAGAPWSYERLDMNEFAEKHTQARLFGAPPGYIGYDDGNDLAAILRNNPRTVVLLDEIDKAHPHIWRSLMNLMDAGRLSGLAGDIDARQSILLFTSNKDAAAIQSLADASEDRLRMFLRDHDYPPEIVARMSRILVFKPLSADITTRIVVLTVQRIVESYGLYLDHIDPDSVTSLAERAPLYAGGRDVEHFIEHEIDDQLSRIAGNSAAVRIHGTGRLEIFATDDDN